MNYKEYLVVALSEQSKSHFKFPSHKTFHILTMVQPFWRCPSIPSKCIVQQALWLLCLLEVVDRVGSMDQWYNSLLLGEIVSFRKDLLSSPTNSSSMKRNSGSKLSFFSLRIQRSMSGVKVGWLQFHFVSMYTKAFSSNKSNKT